MQTLILTFAVFLVAVLAMVIGVVITGRSLKGSCGGPACKCVAQGDSVLDCDDDEIESEGSLPLYSGR